MFVGRKSKIERLLVSSHSGQFPVLVRTGEESMAVVYRTDGAHYGITGTLSMSHSSDGGMSWSDSRRVTPRWEDARNPSFGYHAGRLILAYWCARRHAYVDGEDGFRWDPKEPGEIESIPALAVRLSEDLGSTWSPPEYYLSRLFSYASPYGRMIATQSGDLLMPIYGRIRGEKAVGSGVIRSVDSGRSWGGESLIASGYNESALLVRSDGTLLAAARSETRRNVDTFAGDSDGVGWKRIGAVTEEGEHPADLTLLQSGLVLLTFGRRRRPFGCAAIVSSDGGVRWDTDREALLAGDGVRNADLGYPSTVQLEDGKICTALYYASGSSMSDPLTENWGEVSCQLLRYGESAFGL